MNILQSWKQSLSLFAPANFVPFIKQVGKSTGALFLFLMSRWYLWIVPLVVLILQDVINQHVIKQFLVKVYPTSQDPNVLLTWTHFLACPIGLATLLFHLISLWLFGFVYQAAFWVRSGEHEKPLYQKRLLWKYAPFLVVISVLWTILTYGTYTWIIPMFGVQSVIGNTLLLFVFPIYRIALYVFVSSWSYLEAFYISVLYARHLVNPATGIWKGLMKAIWDIFYLLPALLIVGMVVPLSNILWGGFSYVWLHATSIDTSYIRVLFYYLLFPIVINFWVNFYEWQFKRQPGH